MLLRGALLSFALLLLPACQGHHRLEALHGLSDESRELLAKYKQFMSEGQQDAFLAQPTDDDRRAFIAGLHVEDRLAGYPVYIRDAIWAQEVVPGMDAAAVLLAWGLPVLREWDEAERARGNDVQRWSYRKEGQDVQVLFLNQVVSQVLRDAPKP